MPPKRIRENAQNNDDGGCSKRIRAEENQKCLEDLFLSPLNVYILPAGIQKARLSVLKTQVMKYGGNVQNAFDSAKDLSHVIIEDNVDLPRVKRILKLDSILDLKIVKSSWLSLCLRTKRLENCDSYQLFEEKGDKVDSPPKEEVSPHKKSAEPVSSDFGNSSDYDSSDDDDQHNSKIGIRNTSSVKILPVICLFISTIIKYVGPPTRSISRFLPQLRPIFLLHCPINLHACTHTWA